MLAGRLARAPDLAARCTRTPPDFNNPDWAALLDAVSVAETRLFRLPGQFATLAELLPGLGATACRQGRALRLLSAGCASGEEAWSLAALALRHAPPSTRIEVLGLDMCRPSLDVARAGKTGAGLGDPLALVPGEILPFLADECRRPRPHPALRAVTRFDRANLRDALPGHFDVIFCRNVLIYLHEAARREVVARLTEALHPGGVLGLGPTDQRPAGLVPLGEMLWRRDA
ncbi:CheR family methyltransferase [Sabulicella rubraurantiaca]|uniref:CheR family methyltransferase n=1 Tax=Sabulicella rubraurantiaca TaxID=2811429 RepID=UPI001A96AD37|nr:CheR family methyltransferase [Sabulicella rubraurantiaca]